MDGSPSSPENGLQDNTLEFYDTNHTGQLLSHLGLLHKEGRFCDAILVVGEHEMNIHRAVLAAASSYFHDMFHKVEEEESGQNMFKLRDTDWDSFKYLLDFIYTGRLAIPCTKVTSVYNTAQKLRLPSAIHICATYLASCLTPDNCLGIRLFATEADFREQVDRYISDNIKDVTNSKRFYGLPRIAVEIVGADEDVIDNARPMEMLPLVVDWVQGKMTTCKGQLDSLTENVNMLYLNPDNSLTDCVDVDDTTLNENVIVQDYKKLAKKKHSGAMKAKDTQQPTPDLNGQGAANYWKFNLGPNDPVGDKEWATVASYKTKDRTYMAIAMLNGALTSISLHYRPAVPSGSGTDDPDSPVHGSTSRMFDRHVSLTPLQVMHTNRCAFGLKVMNGQLFACGGYDRGECLKSVEVYSLQDNTWTLLNEMKTARGRFSIAEHHGNIYACGGSDGLREVVSVERYSAEDGTWTVETEAPKPKASPGIAILDDRLYVIGGSMGQTTVTDCEVYDLCTKTWSSIAPLNIARFQVAICAHEGQIYAIGGTNGWRCINEVEVYDPSTDAWQLLPPLNICRRGAGVDVYNGKIHIVGGNDGTSALNSTEVFDPENGAWTSGPSLGIPRANCGVATVDDRLVAVGGFSGKRFLDTMEYLDYSKSEDWCSYLPAMYARSPSKEDTEKSDADCGQQVVGSSQWTKSHDCVENGGDAENGSSECTKSGKSKQNGDKIKNGGQFQDQNQNHTSIPLINGKQSDANGTNCGYPLENGKPVENGKHSDNGESCEAVIYGMGKMAGCDAAGTSNVNGKGSES